MGKKGDEVRNPFVCNVADVTFIIRFYPDHELHILTDKSNRENNFTEKHCPSGPGPVGTSGANDAETSSSQTDVPRSASQPESRDPTS
jgi:hypothetical protein